MTRISLLLSHLPLPADRGEQLVPLQRLGGIRKGSVRPTAVRHAGSTRDTAWRLLTLSTWEAGLGTSLAERHYLVDEVTALPAVESLAARASYAALVLDARAAGAVEALLEVVRSVRGRGTRVPIVLVGLGESSKERIAALDAGADDALSGQVAVDELAARLSALLRRGLPDVVLELVQGDLRISTSARIVMLAGHSVGLTALEYDLLMALAAEPDRWHSTIELAARLRPPEVVARGIVADYVLRLRRKLGQGAIHSRRSLGYRLVLRT